MNCDMPDLSQPAPDRREATIAAVVFGLLLGFHVWGVSVGWNNGNLPGNDFRQTQTAMTALFVQREHNFALAYPTPVLGKPWSIPFEFPLYQWTVVVVSDATGMPLTQAGRAVSAGCFYLALPAAWLLLGRLGLGRSRRLVVLGMVVTCPLYVFYARAFLIETMALMFSLWFLHAFVTAVERRSWGWLVVANVAGVGAGLVKVTTFMLYLMPAGIWAATWLWRARPRRDGTGKNGTALGRTAGWIAAGTMVPFAATLGWIRFTDAVKALNPSSRDLVSSAMHPYNFGTWQTRFSAEIWAQHGRIILNELTTVPVVAVAAVLALLFARRDWRWPVWCVGLFFAVQLLFPVLYAWHEYYFVANAVLLMTAMGLVLCAVLDAAVPRWVAWCLILGLYAGQISQYLVVHYPVQRIFYSGGDELTQALRAITQPDDVLVIAGEDWGSMTPYHSQRRALMLRRDTEDDWPFIRTAFDQLKGEPVVALLLADAQRNNRTLVELSAQYFDIDPRPLCAWKNVVVYLRRDRRSGAADVLRRRTFLDLQVLGESGQAGGGSLTRREVAIGELPPEQRRLFSGLSPQPVRFYTTFGMDINQEHGEWFLNAHPDTRLWFRVPAGRRQVAAEFHLVPGSYENLARGDATDGVEFAIYEIKPDGSRQQVYDRLLNPMDNLGDRGFQRIALEVEVAEGSELLFETGPGPRGNYTRDWASWGPITIK
jgi:hypothetical protein